MRCWGRFPEGAPRPTTRYGVLFGVLCFAWCVVVGVFLLVYIVYLHSALGRGQAGGGDGVVEAAVPNGDGDDLYSDEEEALPRLLRTFL